MRFPNKVFEYNSSVLRNCVVLEVLDQKKKGVSAIELVRLCRKKVPGVHFLLESLNVLYSIGEIEINRQTGRIYHVK
jgi:hypothetical protein